MLNLSEKIKTLNINATQIAESLLPENYNEISEKNNMADQNRENRYSTQQRNNATFNRESNGTLAPEATTTKYPTKKNLPDYKSPEYKEKRAKLRNELNSIDITEVLDRLGGESHQDGDPHKWKVNGSNIIFKGNRWQNVQSSVSGYGGIQLCRLMLGLEHEYQAINWMIENFGESIPEDMKVSPEENKESVFSPPEEDIRNISFVKEYLVEKRGIPLELIEELIDSGKIYSDDKKNCVFLAKASAEIRSTIGGFKGCCEGSSVNSSGFYVMLKPKVSEGTVALVEAAIDALSYNAIFPGRVAYSTNGSGRFLLQYDIMIESLSRDYKVKAAFDSDWAGDESAQRLFNALFLRKALPYKSKDMETPITEEHIDEWIKEGFITFKITNSPHYNFFNEGWSAEKKSLDEELIVDEEGKSKMIMVDNGKISRPTISINVSKDLHEILQKGHKDFIISEATYKGIINKMGLARERPLNKKDWNEELLLLGDIFRNQYSNNYKNNFKFKIELPDYLEYYKHGDASLNPFLNTIGEVNLKNDENIPKRKL